MTATSLGRTGCWLAVGLLLAAVSCAEKDSLTLGKVCEGSAACGPGKCYRNRCYNTCRTDRDCEGALRCRTVTTSDGSEADLCVPDEPPVPDVVDVEVAADLAEVEDAAPDVVRGAEGEPCRSDDDCESANCRLAASDVRFCQPQGSPCSGLDGSALALGGAVCRRNDRYVCNGPDSFEIQDCAKDCGPYPAVDGCVVDACELCAESCAGDGGCAPDHYCGADSRCQPAAAEGEPCQRNATCKSGSCRQAPSGARFCVLTGFACADPNGAGLVTGEGRCIAGDLYRCAAPDTFSIDPCTRDCGLLAPVDGCAEASCLPCPRDCAVDADCTAEAFCGEQSACAAKRPDGRSCTRDGMCRGGHCQNGFCCTAGDCCAAPGDCPATYAAPAACVDATRCQGTRRDPDCVNFRCVTGEAVPDDSACGPATRARECTPYPPQYCTGQPVQTPPTCGTACTGDADCLGATHCDGTCQPDLGPGLSCDEASDCATGHCENGFCCPAGRCCATAADCPAGPEVGTFCDVPETCQGHRIEIVCADAVCAATAPIDDDRACTEALVAAECGDFPAVFCTGETEQAPPVCPTSCSDDGGCDAGLRCLDGVCVAGRADGSPCAAAAECSSGHCQNGLCCAAGDCCLEPADCPEQYAAAPRCEDATTCQGTRVDAVCEDYLCRTSTPLADDTACTAGLEADACGLYPTVFCVGGAEQTAPTCATQCAADAACDAGAFCSPAALCEARLADGASCTRPGMCVNANCRLNPAGARVCTPAGADCADGRGGGLRLGERVCVSDDSWRCSGADAFEVDDCQCAALGCDAASGACDAAPIQDGVACDGGAGGCLGGACTPFLHPLPAGFAWTPVLGAGPLEDVPAGCGGPLLPCNAEAFAFPWPPDSGQTQCYDAWHQAECAGDVGGPDCATTAFCGQDAQYGLDVAEPHWADGRFEVQGSETVGVVFDHWTGLIWQRPVRQNVDWASALRLCATMGSYAGQSGWRLPDAHELLSVANLGRYAPATDLPNTPSALFWSASTNAAGPGQAWAVHYWGASQRIEAKTLAQGTAVRCVVGNAPTGLPATRYYLAEPVANERVVFDVQTGLLWPRSVRTGDDRWQVALAYCENLSYGGSADWRLPNVLELRTLIDTTRANPAIDPVAFPNTPSLWFWTGTASAGSPSAARAVHFADGRVDSATGLTFGVRCVRTP